MRRPGRIVSLLCKKKAEKSDGKNSKENAENERWRDASHDNCKTNRKN